MNERKVIEAILLLAEEPVPAQMMGEVLEVPTDQVESALHDLKAAYEREDRGFVLRESATGWRLYTDPACGPWLERFVRGRPRTRLSAPALEVLAIVAYRQPISRSQIAEIRGVDSDGVVKTLQERGLIQERGRDRGPGSPVLFGLSETCLEQLGLRSTEELPPLTSFMPDAEAVEEMESRLSPGV